MKNLVLALILLLLTASAFAEEKKPEATVSFKKTKNSVEYSIDFIPGFQYNHEAPFRFNLLDKKKEVMSKAAFKDFKKNEAGTYKYSTKGKEKFVNYWFVACKYVDGEITGCKTFTDTLEIK
jgi:hypothetical protein